MGGMIAQELTLKAPARVDHLALGCTHFGGKNRLLADPDVLAAFGRVGKQSAEATIRDLLAVNFTPAFIDAHPEVIEDLVRHGLASRLFPAIYSGQTRAIVGHDVETRLGEIGAPTLVVAGSEDRLIPPDNSRLLAARVPGAKLVVLPDIAHMFWIEAPDLAEAVLRRHLPS